MRAVRRGLAAAALAVVWAAGAWGQERRTVAVNVLNEEGQQVVGLKAENFRGKYRGKAVRIVSAEWDAGPRRIVILVDRSGSMGWGEKWVLARKAAEDVVFYGPPENQAGLVLFAARVEEIVPLERGRAGVAERLTALMQGRDQPEGRTALSDALMEGLRLLEPAQEGDALYVITDAGENASRVNSETVEQAVYCSGVRAFFFHLSQRRDWDMREYLSARGMVENLAKGSGGFMLEVTSASELLWRPAGYKLSPEQQQEVAAGARRLYELVASYYRVEVELPEEVDKTRGWELEVVGEDGKRMKVKVVYPRKLAACGEKGN